MDYSRQKQTSIDNYFEEFAAKSNRNGTVAVGGTETKRVFVYIERNNIMFSSLLGIIQ